MTSSYLAEPSPGDSTGGAGAAASGPGAPETRDRMEASLPLLFPAWLLIWGSGLPSPDPHTQPPDSCFTPHLTGPGPSSRVVMRKSEVWSYPALGEKVGQGGPAMSVGKVVCISSGGGFGRGPQCIGCTLCLGWAVIKALALLKDAAARLLQKE